MRKKWMDTVAQAESTIFPVQEKPFCSAVTLYMCKIKMPMVSVFKRVFISRK